MTKEILERQNKDLRIRLDNQSIKREIERIESEEKINRLQDVLKGKDSVIAMLQKEIAKLNGELAAEKAKNKDLSERIEELEDMANRLRAMFEKDSTTSSKPPSSDGYKKATVINMGNSGTRKRGGQPGHEGHTLKLFPEPTNIVEQRPPEKCGCGGRIDCSGSYTAKQLVDVAITVTINEERSFDGCCSICGKKHSGKFSAGYVNPVQYGDNVKAVVASLNAFANVTNNKTSEILSSLTGGQINISDGTVVNMLHSLSSGLDETIKAIRDNLVAGKILHSDETGCRVNGHLDWMQIYSNESYTLFGRNEKRGSLAISGNDILLLFTGILVHDHFSSYYNYAQISHAECNVHILRYLEAVIKIQQHEWAKDLAEFLRGALHEKHKMIEANQTAFSDDKKQEYRKRYFEILDAGQIEFDAAIAGKTNVTYYDEERRLLARLREYADQHLLFIMDFDVPFGNNNAEHGARFLKSKKNSAGCFRSAKGADDYARVASFIATLRKQKMNVFESILGLFSGIAPTFVAATNSS
jgi:transposase